MADEVQLNANTTTGDKVAADEIAGRKHQRVKVQYGADGSATDVAHGAPLPVDAGLTTPSTTYVTTASLAAGGSTDLDSTQIGSGLTGKLVAVLLCSSVALKGELKTVLNGVESAVKCAFFTRAGESLPLVFPSKRFFAQAESATAGLDAFRITVTNLDPTQAVDVYATFFYDEE